MRRLLFILILCICIADVYSQSTELPGWQKGYLDIHFINTGRGNAALYILPDGTTLLVDAGDLPSSDSLRRSPAVPDNSKTPAQWIVEYIKQFYPAGKKVVLDYALVTHYHDDHFGHFDNSVKTHPEGGYKLSGITEVGSLIPIKVLLDRGFDFPINYRDTVLQNNLGKNNEAAGYISTIKNYWKFINYQGKVNGLENYKLKVGSTSQIKLLNNADDYPYFKIKNLFADGEISNSWNDSIGYSLFKAGEFTDENNLSCGIKITYGKFDFYTGGDIPGINETGASEFRSMEALAAPVIGAVDVATLNHHGNRDSQNEYFVRTIRPRVWIGQSWTSNHPGEEVLRRITSTDIYPGERDLFTNFFSAANSTVIGRRGISSYKSTSGHIVVRVKPGGDEYDIYILNDKTPEKEIIAHYHYMSR
jgi:beta-lactamase superfamily II metal-dependent hydrolase